MVANLILTYIEPVSKPVLINNDRLEIVGLINVPNYDVYN